MDGRLPIHNSATHLPDLVQRLCVLRQRKRGKYPHLTALILSLHVGNIICNLSLIYELIGHQIVGLHSHWSTILLEGYQGLGTNHPSLIRIYGPCNPPWRWSWRGDESQAEGGFIWVVCPVKVWAEVWEIIAVAVKPVFCELLWRTCEGKRRLDLQKQWQTPKSY